MGVLSDMAPGLFFGAKGSAGPALATPMVSLFTTCLPPREFSGNRMKIDDAFEWTNVGAGGAAGGVRIGADTVPLMVPAGLVVISLNTYGMPGISPVKSANVASTAYA